MNAQLKYVAYTDDDDETGLEPAIPAATLVIFRESRTESAPQLLMVRRAAHMKFAAGAAVFPGGRVDPDDHILAQSFGDSTIAPADAAARVAAIRETLEETGLPIGILNADGEAPDLETIEAMRTALLAEQPFSLHLKGRGCTLNLHALTPFARWRPNFKHERVFDTRFYLANAPETMPHLNVVESENTAIFWLSAAAALAKADAGELHMIFPTRRNMERLAQYRDFDEAVASTAEFPSRRITPYVEEEDGQMRLCIRDDCGYPVTSEVLNNAMRG